MQKLLAIIYTLLCLPSMILLIFFDSDNYDKKLKESKETWDLYMISHTACFWGLVILAIWLL